MESEISLTQPYVEFLIIADRVESINGKLYMMGGAWDSYTLGDPAQPARFGLAIGVSVPWGRTNERHQLQLRVDDADGQSVIPEFSIDFQVGRPPALPPGTSQRLVWAVNGDFPLPGEGAYTVVASLDGVEDERTSFRVAFAQPQANPG